MTDVPWVQDSEVFLAGTGPHCENLEEVARGAEGPWKMEGLK